MNYSPKQSSASTASTHSMRLDKAVASMTGFARAKARLAIRSGEVRVDGTVVKEPDFRVDPSSTSVTASGERLKYREHVYLMLNKPPGYLSATRDDRAATVADLIPVEFAHKNPFPVGRLDKDAAGLLIMTDDGVLAHAALSPKRGVEKEYVARVDRDPKPGSEDIFATGVILGDGTTCRPAKLERVGAGIVRVTLTEGRFHQVKRMLWSCGSEVVELTRERFHTLRLDPALALGSSRELTPDELISLLALKTPVSSICKA